MDTRGANLYIQPFKSGTGSSTRPQVCGDSNVSHHTHEPYTVGSDAIRSAPSAALIVPPGVRRAPMYPFSRKPYVGIPFLENVAPPRAQSTYWSRADCPKYPPITVNWRARNRF